LGKASATEKMYKKVCKAIEEEKKVISEVIQGGLELRGGRANETKVIVKD